MFTNSRWTRFDSSSEGLRKFAFGIVVPLMFLFLSVYLLRVDSYTTALAIDKSGNEFPIVDHVPIITDLYAGIDPPVSNYSLLASTIMIGATIIFHYVLAAKHDEPWPKTKDGFMRIASNSKVKVLGLALITAIIDVAADTYAVLPDNASPVRTILTVFYSIFFYQILSEITFVVCLEIVVDSIVYPVLKKFFGRWMGDGNDNKRGGSGKGQQKPRGPMPSADEMAHMPHGGMPHGGMPQGGMRPPNPPKGKGKAPSHRGGGDGPHPRRVAPPSHQDR